MLRNLEYVACYYITGSYKTQDYGYCMTAKHYRDFAYAVSFLPYYWRAMQVDFKGSQALCFVLVFSYNQILVSNFSME